MTSLTTIEHHVTSADLVAELAVRAPVNGPNAGLWPGLTIYRFTEPTEPRWEEIRAMSLGIVAQGSKAVWSDGTRFVYDQFNYLVISHGSNFECAVLEASPLEPCLCLVLEVEPALVRKVSADMGGAANPIDRDRRPPGEVTEKCSVSTLDDDLLASIVRFLRALTDGPDRRVLAPLYLQETVYRVLQREQFDRLLELAAQQSAGNPVGAALAYVNDHLAEPLSVTTLAAQVNLSPSAFSRLFREVTDRSPYQFVKEFRLNRSRDLLIEGRRGVTEVARSVGYASTSHFIKEFRARFGTTPRDYADAHLVLRRRLG